jgi:type IV pilus assembly protein PilV
MRRTRLHRQSGVLLLEVLVAILIFSVGILGTVDLLAVSTKQASDAQYRTAAAVLADDLIAGMWTSSRTQDALESSYGSLKAGAAYSKWVASITAALPGVSAQSGTLPIVTFAPVPAGNANSLPSTRAQVTVMWQAPGDTRVHSHVTIAQLK